MKKKVIIRCLIGAPIGLAISTLITIAISLAVRDGHFYPVAPELITDTGGELNAVILQAICALLYGAAWAGASVIWEIERWSILRQSVTHLIICSLATFPIAYFTRWMPHNAAGILLYFGIFFGIYLFIWLSQYFAMKIKLKRINEKVKENRAVNG